MDDQPLFLEDVMDALKEAVRACGGPKVVGPKLWPEKTPEAAARALHDCLNPHREARLNPEQTILILGMAGAKGFHKAMEFIAEQAGYKVEPVVAEDAIVEAQRELADLLRHQEDLVLRMERMMKITGRLRAA